MYAPLKALALRLLKAPTEPPELPAGTHASAQVFRASPRFLTYRLLGVAIGAVGGLIGLFVGGVVSLVEQEVVGIVLVVLAVVPFAVGLVFAYFAVRIDFDLRYYIVTDRSLRVREGAVIVKEMTITHANVQNLRVVQGPLLRLFDIWNLKVDTAGGGGATAEGGGTSHSIQMAGIENAHEVRDLILSHLRQRGGGGTGLGDPDDEDEDGEAASASADVLAALRDVRDSAARLRAAAG